MTSSSAASSSHLHITITNNASSTITTNTNNNTKSHHSSSVSPRSGSGGSGSGGGGGGGGGTTNQACAACKYQRRKCNPDCPLAPYFPADQQRRFLNAHRLFGVSNILKTLRRLKPELCDSAMQTLIYQAEMRAMDPVGGCCRMIIDLEHTSELLSAELAALQQHLDMCRQAAASGVAGGDVMDGPCADLEVTSSNHQQEQLLLHADQDHHQALYIGQEGADPVIQNGADHDDSRQPQYHGGQQHQQQQLYDYFYYEATGAGSDEAGRKPSGSGVDINVDVMQHFDYDSSCEVDDHHKVDQLEPMISSSLDEHYQIGQKEYEMKVASFVDVLDVRPELQAVDGNADIGVKEELQEEDPKNNDDIALRKAAHMAAESSHCRLGLGF
ncbi:hypothetical protein CFC21_044462 [Triticum aestivum]|uniref:LOB domain-containing protein n=2 Tax=Triticum aestivum TaxID=4565 RepID=A0A9R1JXK4_WHEAT|nr:uncharacterized protein LOC123066715 [Triticum aestivum]KAF7033355.1 hypothetical protein CFC21_044462 [Triticum aestivum]CDM86601.1 unnamed protein product [Triticum aestivum]